MSGQMDRRSLLLSLLGLCAAALSPRAASGQTPRTRLILLGTSY